MPRRREQARRVGVVDVGRQGAAGLGAGVAVLGCEVLGRDVPVRGEDVSGGDVSGRRRRRGRRRSRATISGTSPVPSTASISGISLLQLVAIALGQAAGDDQPLAGAVLLVLRHLEDGVDRLLLGRVDERAGVDDEHVGVGGVLRQLVARLLREPEHHLGVDEILRTAEGNQTDLHETSGLDPRT